MKKENERLSQEVNQSDTNKLGKSDVMLRNLTPTPPKKTHMNNM